MAEQVTTNDSSIDSAASALSAGFDGSLPEYFHELTDEQWETLKASGMTWNEAAKRFKPPAWCSEQAAVDPMGCWSLVGRMVKDEDYCKDCDLHKTPNGGSEPTERR